MPNFQHKQQSILLRALFLIALLFVWHASAQDSEPIIERSQIENRITQLEGNAMLDPETKARAQEVLRVVLDHITAAESWRTKAAELAKATEEAPATIQAIGTQLALPVDSFLLDMKLEEKSLDELTLLGDELEAQLTLLRDEYKRADTESAQRTERRKALSGIQTEALARLQAVKVQRDTEVLSDNAEIAEAQKLLSSARVQAIEGELSFYTRESQSFESRGKVLNLIKDSASRQITQREQDQKDLQALIATRRRMEAAQAAEAAQQSLLEASNAPAQVRELAEKLAREIAQAAEERVMEGGILGKTETLNAAIKGIEAEYSIVEKEFEKARHRVEVAERSNVVGTMLRTQMAKLPEHYVYQRKLRQYEEELRNVQFKIMDIEEVRRTLNDIDALVRAVQGDTEGQASGKQEKALTKLMRELYQNKRTALETSLNDYEVYSEKLDEIQGEIQRLLDVTDEFGTYIDERILWARSGSPLHFSDTAHVMASMRWFLDTAHIAEWEKVLFSGRQGQSLFFALNALALLAYFTQRRKIINALKRAAEWAQDSDNVRVRPTLQAFFLSVVHSLAVPGVLYNVAWRIALDVDASEFVRATAQGVQGATILWGCCNLFIVFMSPWGLCPAHFNWDGVSCARIVKLLRYSAPALLFLFFLQVTLQSQENTDWQESTGRVLFFLFLIIATYCLNKLLHRNGGALLDLYDMRRGKGHISMRPYWRFGAILFVLALAALSLVGYNYTAFVISLYLARSILACFVLIVCAELVLRWATLGHRKLANEEQKNRLNESSLGLSPGASAKALALADRQTSRLVWIVCLFSALALFVIIWNDMIPALRFLDAVKLWEYKVELTHEVPSPDGTKVLETTSSLQPITMRHLVVALVCAFLTFMAMRNLPGFIEIILIQSTKLAAGERYAVCAITSYIILGIGIVITFNYLGLHWSQMQWLIAALGVGLGFGLQEIFANFISGLLILFERPIRVGDTVTVGDISGTVSKIHIRATHIIAFNRQELIVPNKEFVTGRLVNWDLSGQALRVDIPVGVAYGSDTQKAREIMLEVAKKNPLVLSDPAPDVFFMSFGDNSLNLELRVFSPNVECLLKIRDQMHTGIDNAFRDGNFEISHPQRDLHLRSVEDSILARLAPGVLEKKD